MKMNLIKSSALVGLLFLGACSNDDNTETEFEDFASLTVSDQSLENNMTLSVDAVTLPDDGWIVIHRSNENGPVVPEIISEPELVNAGVSTDVEVSLKSDVSVENGEKLWVMLHNDTGIEGEYEFDGSNGLDEPYTGDDGEIVMVPVEVSVDPSGNFTAKDQDIEDNTVVVESVTMNTDGWVVIHANDNGAPVVPEIISEPKFLEAGTHSNVEVTLENSAAVNAGDMLWVMLHADTGVSQEYEFDGSNGLDTPITDADGNVVTSSIEALSVELTGSFEAADQTLSQNMIMVEEVTMNNDGWVVIHKDNGSDGPMVPEIISVPKFIEAGTTGSVKVQLENTASISDGETLWVMLHTDTGAEAVYEFDGSNGLDSPIVGEDGNVVTSPVVITAPAIVANDQPVTENKVTIAEVHAATDGWIVIHNQTATGEMELPDIIGKTYVSAGSNFDVVVELDENITYTAGQKLYPMLHIDEAPVEEYNFPGVDIPEVFGFAAENTVVTSFTVQ